jgi:glucokinase
LNVILAGDVGGTKCNLAVFEERSGALVDRHGRKFSSRDFARFEDVVSEFVRGVKLPAGERITSAGFGVAGPVRGGVAVATNLPWRVESRSLAALLGLPAVAMINDLEATAHGIGALPPGDFEVFQAGAPGAKGTQAVIAAGTGLGEAGLFWDGKTHRPIPSEGGHAGFAPNNELEDALLVYLRKRFGGHVSRERVVSGQGIRNIYEFLRDTTRGTEEPWLREAIQKDDPAAVISKAALEGTSPICVQTLDLFVELYGSAAGDLALTMLATGGVFIAGGIAPKIMPKLRAGGFLRAFLAEGRLRPVIEHIPVRVVLNERVGLFGAARCATLAG